MPNVNGQQVDGMRRNIKACKAIGFAIKLDTNVKIVVFLGITFNFKNCTYRPYENPNDLLSYINEVSNHAPQVINQLPKTINERSRNSEIPVMKKFLIYLNINKKKPLETVDTTISK